MSKNWYPVINYELCAECGACTDKCSNGVYDKGKAPRPVVVYPQGCIEGCHGCGNLCPNGAIEYFGDSEHSSLEGCGCGCDNDCSCEEDCGCGAPAKSGCCCKEDNCCGG